MQNESSLTNGFSKIRTAEEVKKYGRDLNSCYVYSYCILEHTPVLKGSITGTIIGNGERTFIVDEIGNFNISGDKLEDIISIIPNDCEMYWTTGEVIIAWDKILAPKEYELIMNYEYNYG